MGAEAARRADLLVVTDDNPRTEDPTAIRASILAGVRGVAGASVVEIGDRAEAIAYALTRARPGDAVVVAGKGHETMQEVHGIKHPFVDADVLANLLADLLEGSCG